MRGVKQIVSGAVLFCMLCAVCLLTAGCGEAYSSTVLANTLSKDGTSIAYSVYGAGDVTVVFVHGWGGDGRYWHHQVPYFATRYRVVTVDLAGHGDSGTDRPDYTMQAFGEDVAAVLEAVEADRVILAGHSMGGAVILHAAALSPDRVIGLIGVDTLQDMGQTWSEEEKRQFYDPLEANFKANTPAFIRMMFPETADPELVNTITQDIASMPREVGLSAMRELMKMSDEELVRQIDVPIKCVNADLWPTNVERNRQLAPGFELSLMEGYGHFIMLEAPDAFNARLEEMIERILEESD